ncbi:hypothetical protein [Actinoplanes hulinensis]|nr:hypothetical protein [Actinoplanes hulinensis]
MRSVRRVVLAAHAFVVGVLPHAGIVALRPDRDRSIIAAEG